jgi:hypothetical protein
MSEELLDWEQGLTGESRGVGYANPYDNPMVGRPDDEERMRMAQAERAQLQGPTAADFEFLNRQGDNPVVPLDQSDAPSQADIDELNALTMSPEYFDRHMHPEKYADKVPPAFVGRNTMFIDPTSPWDLGSTLEGSGISQGRKSWEGLKSIPANIASLIPETANALAPFYTVGSVDTEPIETIRKPILNPLAYTNNVKPKITAEYAKKTLLPLYIQTVSTKGGYDKDYIEETAIGMLLNNYEIVDREFM